MDNPEFCEWINQNVFVFELGVGIFSSTYDLNEDVINPNQKLTTTIKEEIYDHLNQTTDAISVHLFLNSTFEFELYLKEKFPHPTYGVISGCLKFPKYATFMINFTRCSVSGCALKSVKVACDQVNESYSYFPTLHLKSNLSNSQFTVLGGFDEIIDPQNEQIQQIFASIGHDEAPKFILGKFNKGYTLKSRDLKIFLDENEHEGTILCIRVSGYHFSETRYHSRGKPISYNPVHIHDVKNKMEDIKTIIQYNTMLEFAKITLGLLFIAGTVATIYLFR